jgi:hypothetical protein
MRWCRYVSELLYIHSKVMIVDDRRVIVCLSFFSCCGGFDQVPLDGVGESQRSQSKGEVVHAPGAKRLTESSRAMVIRRLHWW